MFCNEPPGRIGYALELTAKLTWVRQGGTRGQRGQPRQPQQQDIFSRMVQGSSESVEAVSKLGIENKGSLGPVVKGRAWLWSAECRDWLKGKEE